MAGVPADLPLGVGEVDVVTPDSSDPGRFEPGRARADHDHGFGPRRWHDLHLGLAGGSGVHCDVIGVRWAPM